MSEEIKKVIDAGRFNANMREAISFCLCVCVRVCVHRDFKPIHGYTAIYNADGYRYGLLCVITHLTQ